MPPSRNNTVRFSDLAPISAVGVGDIIPVVDTSVPTLVNKKINVQDFNRSLPVSLQVTQLGANSANWNSAYSSTVANSAFWSNGGSYGSVYSANSAEYESTFTAVNSFSGAWNSSYSTLNATSGVFTTVQDASGAWNSGASAYASLNTLSAGTWLLKAGDQLTGTLTTTKTLTSQFTNMDELVSKRYVDAMSTISGNFVPSLYYTKIDFSTGVPVVSTSSLQFNQATVGVPGSPWFGSIAINKDQFGTDVPAFVFSTTNNNIGGLGRAGIYINSGSSGSFSYSQGSVGLDWNGPNTSTVFNLTRNGTSRLSIFDDVNLNSNLFIRGNNALHSLLFDQWRSISFSNTSSRLSASNFTIEGNSVRFQDIGNPLNQNLTLNYGSGLVTLDVGNELFLRQAGSRRIGIYFQGDVDLGPGILRTAAANNSVGIGTTVPNEKLTVFGNISASGNITGLQIRSYHTTTSRYAYFDANADAGYSVILGNSQTGIGLMCRGEVGQGILGTNLVTRGYVAFSNSGLINTGSTPPQGQDLRLYRDDAYILAQRFDTNPNIFRIYNTYTDANNYERLSLSATRIAYEAAGTGVSRDLTIQSTGNIVLSAGGSINLNQALPTFFNSLSANNITAVNNLYIGDNLSSIYQSGGWIYLQPSNGVFLQRYAQINGSFNNATLLTIQAQPGHTMPGSFIKCLSGDGKTLFEVNSAGSFSPSSFTFPAPTDNLGTVRVINDTAGVLRPGIYSTGNGISLATYGNGGLSNIGSVFIQHLLARRSVFSASSPAVGGGNYDETIPNIALKVGGNIGFTDVSLDGSNFVRPISATMGYDWTTNLINLSGRAGKVGFRFDSVEAGNNRPEIYNNGHLFITSNFGGGRRIYFNGVDNQGWNPFELGYNGAFAYGTIEITATQQPGTYTFPYFKITQDVKQLSNLVQIVSSNGSTILSYSSAGVLNLNSRIFLKPDGLIQFTNTSSTTPAIKGTTTTVQARTGDDSQFTFLQGKLQTDQAASAGTFTPDKYIILYDSTGTAYKVPVQAL